MDKIDFQEKVLGGIFGGIAIIAAIAEMFINGIDAASVVGAIKDVFGTRCRLLHHCQSQSVYKIPLSSILVYLLLYVQRVAKKTALYLSLLTARTY